MPCWRKEDCILNYGRNNNKQQHRRKQPPKGHGQEWNERSRSGVDE